MMTKICDLGIMFRKVANYINIYLDSLLWLSTAKSSWKIATNIHIYLESLLRLSTAKSSRKISAKYPSSSPGCLTAKKKKNKSRLYVLKRSKDCEQGRVTAKRGGKVICVFLVFHKVFEFKVVLKVCIIKWKKQRQIYRNMSTPPP